MHTRGWLIGLLLGGAMLLSTGAAARGDERRREQGYELEPSTPAAPIVFAVVGLAAIAAVGFKPSKRSHLD